ncbi:MULTISPECIES: phosphoribosyltransferase [unclassified Synechococcus]|uniref:phosphoribosyltransferase n=1 Tax=unclassified Synechococcus TaxID=2626047 RepID=UPI00103FF7A7|nr:MULTISPECIES: phosphoribosyltransferase family protein [unclassified Synechococcus]QNG26808.1 phosphoribosyltransferase [Synechococcus sp. HK01-R]TCD58678.1 phosphoribosyltransferase [Synechococcus sp. BS56D]
MDHQAPVWVDRHQAGLALAECLQDCAGARADTCLVALPRGGVAVAAAMAQRLDLPLLTWSVRKIVEPSRPELALGAVAGEGVVLWRHEPGDPAWSMLPQAQDWLLNAQEELERRHCLFDGPDLGRLFNHHLIVVDDGIATGMTVLAALQSLRLARPSLLTLAVPVMDRSLEETMRLHVDRLEVLRLVDHLSAVGLWYERFEQLSDRDVLNLLRSQGAPGDRTAPLGSASPG